MVSLGDNWVMFGTVRGVSFESSFESWGFEAEVQERKFCLRWDRGEKKRKGRSFE